MAGHAARGERHPARRLLGEGHAPDVGRVALARQDAAAFGQHVARIAEQVRAMIDDQLGAAPAARLFVGRGQQDHVAPEDEPAPLRLHQGEGMRDRDPLRVEGPPAHHVAAAHHAREGVHGPGAGVGRHHVEVGEQDQRPGRPRPGQARPDGRAGAGGVGQGDHPALDPLPLEVGRQPLGEHPLVPRGIRGVDPDRLAEQDGRPFAYAGRLVAGRGSEAAACHQKPSRHHPP